MGAGGTAKIAASFTQGTHLIVATYAGDANSSGSTSAALKLVVDLATTAVALNAIPNPAVIGTAVQFTAKVTGDGGVPTGTVNFMADGKLIGTGTLDKTGTATLAYAALTVGTHAIAADYSGDTDDAASASPTVSEVVQAIPTVTDLGTATVANTQTLVATVFGTGVSGPTPTGTVTFKNGGTAIGTSTLDSSGVATLVPNLPNGSYTIVAYYSGDTPHLPSQSKPVAITGAAADFNLTVTPSSVTIPTKQNVTVTVTVSSSGGFSDLIELGCGSVPAAVTCHFSSFNVGLAANGTATAYLTIDTNYPLSGGSAMNAAPGAPALRWPACCFRSVRFSASSSGDSESATRALNLALLVALSGAAMLATGCGGFTQISATPGKYVIQVTGVGAQSGLTRYRNVTLNITQ